MNRIFHTINLKIHKFLDLAHLYAEQHTGCCKVSVGCVIVDEATLHVISLGANVDPTGLCKKEGCHRIKIYGDNAKDHRLPSDCRAVHSEIDALLRTPNDGRRKIAFVTRYPCEACARALAIAGIKSVVWGRKQDIPEGTREVFALYNIDYFWADEWEAADDLR